MEQRLIDANELELDSDWDDYEDGYTAYSDTQIKYAPTVLTIPKNPTNGDMIKAMFPNIEIEGIGGLEGCQCVAVSIGMGTSYFALDWWNAPYKVESEE